MKKKKRTRKLSSAEIAETLVAPNVSHTRVPKMWLLLLLKSLSACDIVSRAAARAILFFSRTGDVLAAGELQHRLRDVPHADQQFARGGIRREGR